MKVKLVLALMETIDKSKNRSTYSYTNEREERKETLGLGPE
jgi:hypothetical protein